MFLTCAAFLHKKLTMQILLFDAYKKNAADVRVKLDNFSTLFLLCDVEFSKVRKMIYFNLPPTARKTEEIDFKTFSNILRHFNIKVERLNKWSVNRRDEPNKLQTYYELLNMWPRLKHFYLNRFGNEFSKSYNNGVVETVKLLSHLVKVKTMQTRNRAWLLYLYLESKEQSYIR